MDLSPVGVCTTADAEKQLLDPAETFAAAAVGGEVPVTKGESGSAAGSGHGPPTVP